MRTTTSAVSAPEPPAVRSARVGSVEGEPFTAAMPPLPPSPTMQAQAHARGGRADRSPTQVQLPARGAAGSRGAVRSRVAAPELNSPPTRRLPEAAAAAAAAQRAQQRQPPPILLFEGSPGEQPVQRQPPQWPSPPIPQASPGYAPHAAPSSSSTLRRRQGASSPPTLPPVLLPASHAYAAPGGRPTGGAPERPSQAAAGAGGAPWEPQQQQSASADSQRLFDARAALLVAGLHVR